MVQERGDAEQRARDMDLGADDVLSRPWDPMEMLSRVRHQLRAKKIQDEFRERTLIAEQGLELSRTAFTALAVTEKMKRDAYTIGRGIKIGVAALLVMAGAMGVIYFRFSHRVSTEARRTSGVIARLNLGLMRQEDLIARAQKASDAMAPVAAEAVQPEKEPIEKQSQQLHSQFRASPAEHGGNALEQPAETETIRLHGAESEASITQQIIRSYAQSVCLIHAVVAFRDKATQQRLRYRGLNPDGGPMIDDHGSPEVSLGGSGPDVLVHSFGTGFLVAANGRILTNHHVIEPWWDNDDFSSMTSQGLEPVIEKLEAYFPGSPRIFALSPEKISPDADLALVHAELGELKRTALIIDGGKTASVSGEPVVLMGYPTGIDAILARANESTVREIAAASHGNLDQVVPELAKRNLIHPVITQGHLGDVLEDKIIYDAQTTSGGSGGPLFDQKGKVIGINYAIVRDFGGSNFGIPASYAQAFLFGRTSP
jgi:S1-C subfamily serine protease